VSLNSPNVRDPDQVIAGLIEVYDNVFDRCSQFLDLVNNTFDWSQSTVEFTAGTPTVRKDIRDSDLVSFYPMDFRLPSDFYEFSKIIWTYTNSYAVRHRVSFSGMEQININRYAVGQRYGTHCDDGPGLSRVVSALLYLNDVEGGGETEFIYFNESISPAAGRLIIFPSNYAYTHVAHPPTNNTKYSAAAWFNH
jgi:hypothetical protein